MAFSQPRQAVARLAIGDQFPHAAESPHPYAPGAPPGDLVWSHAITHPGALGIWVHFSALDLAAGDWAVVRDPAGLEAEVFTGSGPQDLGAFWSRRIPGEGVVVDVWSTGSTPGFGAVIDAYAAAYEPVGTQSICGTNDLEDIQCEQAADPGVLRAANGVSRLTIFGDDGSVYACTGFRLECACMLLTALGCVGSASEAFNAIYEFYAQSPTCRTPMPSGCAGESPSLYNLRGGTLDASSGVLNVAVIGRICFADGSNPRLQIDDRAPEPGWRIDIPQHAGGCLMQLGSRNTDVPSGLCEIEGVGASSCRSLGDLIYTCDTDAASLGSPVLAHDDHHVIGIHTCERRFGLCPGAATPILDVLPLLAPIIGPMPGEITGVRVTRRLNVNDHDLAVTWDGDPNASDYRVYFGRLPQPAMGLYPPGSYGHAANPLALPPDGACSTVAAPAITFRARGNWLTGDDDLYLLVVGKNPCGAEGSYGASPINGFGNPLVPIPAGSGCP